ncbi:hypothetical protein [Ruminiclostridium cellulolyticum]|uniref:Uncharacterized protein n=1 Tax=Ruminiclostridium cellulolyticum (strain ATCC 35319 / DSM 5812 / JCM 6584 / H10) TaxID=394503 RepID=B8I4F2_RUMCH|nr:hypothetical protein [Ruminiclostridium cellulolyticum]ACL74506.1 hypothetical protein Ccel_0118 [Ruminiclostridium cellulolyticum H10]
MKKIVISIAMFAIAMALLVAVIVPLANHGRENGIKVEGQLNKVDTEINSLSGTIR